MPLSLNLSLSFSIPITLFSFSLGFALIIRTGHRSRHREREKERKRERVIWTTGYRRHISRGLGGEVRPRHKIRYCRERRILFDSRASSVWPTNSYHPIQ